MCVERKTENILITMEAATILTSMCQQCTPEGLHFLININNEWYVVQKCSSLAINQHRSLDRAFDGLAWNFLDIWNKRNNWFDLLVSTRCVGLQSKLNWTYLSWSSTICNDVIGRLSGRTLIIMFLTFFCLDMIRYFTITLEFEFDRLITSLWLSQWYSV